MFDRKSIKYQELSLLKPLIKKYLSKEEKIISLVNHFPTKESVSVQIEEKKSNYTFSRENLVEALKLQNSLANKKVLDNINSLKNQNTYTVTTGHQLNLFTGPMFFVYKVLHVVNLCEELSRDHEDLKFVPVYWMASEDHDHDEISSFQLFKNKVSWNTKQSGAVGRMDLNENEWLKELKDKLSDKDLENKLFSKVIDIYESSNTLVEAHRRIVNELFGKYGVIIIDGDDSRLKKDFLTYSEYDIKENRSFKEVNKQIDYIKSIGCVPQVNPREINLFYLEKGIRERIVNKDENVLVGDKLISKEDFIKDIAKHPEKISPNVILRPLYQEIILPNIMYVGGAGEVSYWLQLKSVFKAFNITFPLIMLRKSLMILDSSTLKRIKKLDLELEDIFKSKDELKKKIALKSFDDGVIHDSKEKIDELYSKIEDVVSQIDKSLLNTVKAEHAKSLKGLNAIEGKTLKAIKRKNEEETTQVDRIKSTLFPDGVQQERKLNVFEFILKGKESIIEEIKTNIDPFSSDQFTLLLEN